LQAQAQAQAVEVPAVSRQALMRQKSPVRAHCTVAVAVVPNRQPVLVDRGLL
jgi:hypothetical protein